MDAEREIIDIGLLPAQVEDADLGIRDTTVESRLGVRLRELAHLIGQLQTLPGDVIQTDLVLAVPVTSRRTACHFEYIWRRVLSW